MLCCIFPVTIYRFRRGCYFPYFECGRRKAAKAIFLPECSHDDLLEINKSVEDMVDKITTLEIVLKSKLDLINPILEHCDKPMKHSCYFCVKTKFDHLSNKYDKNPHIFKRCGGKILFKIKLLKDILFPFNRHFMTFCCLAVTYHFYSINICCVTI